MIFSKEKINRLKHNVSVLLSEKRMSHTLFVVYEAQWLGEMCLPDRMNELMIAALLHDITKELTYDEHIKLLTLYGVHLDDEDMSSEAVLHSFTAPLGVKRYFPDYATDDILSAVKNHTIGSPDMSLFDEIIFLADYTEQSREYPSCIDVRDFVHSNMTSGDIEGNIKVLHIASLMAIDNTLLHLIGKKKKINSKNILTRNALLSKI